MPEPPGPPPLVTLLQITGGYCLSRCLHVAANLGVADALEEAPRTAAQLATAIGANPDALHRVLRLLASNGVFEAEGDRFRHSPASRLLRTDHPQSLRDLVRMLGLSVNWATFQELEQSVRTGNPSAATVIPEGYWAYYAEHPEESRIFNAAMTGKAHGHVAAVVGAYDFSSFSSIGDIGGGNGHLIRAVLEAAPAARGVLFDLPHVVADADRMESGRLRLMSGDFFKDELPACDAYLMMEVIHDWADAEAVAILKAVRRSAPPRSKLLLIESIVPEGPEPHWSKTLDILMLALLGGKQRTRREYEALCAPAGFSIERQIDTQADISILEARAI